MIDHACSARRGSTRAGTILLGVIALASAGCQRSEPQPSPSRDGSGQRSAPPNPQAGAILGARWKAMFNDPAGVRAAANELGYRVGGYAPAAGGGYRMNGKEQVLPGPTLPTHVATDFVSSGPDARSIDRIEFRFDVVQANPKPATKKEREALQVPRRAVQGFLARFGVEPTDAIKIGLQNFATASDTMYAGHIAIAATQPAPHRRRLLVTITPIN